MRMDELSKTLIHEENKVGKFFKSHSFKELLTFIVFVFLSFILWFTQKSKDNYDATFEVPINYVNLPEKYLLTSQPPLYFQVRVQDQGLELLSLAGKSFSPIEIDLSKEEFDETGKKSIPSRTYDAEIRKRFKSNTKLLSIGPDNLILNYSLEKQKKLPVRVNVEVQFESQYCLNGKISADPPSVIAYGSHEALDTLKEASTVLFQKEQVKDSLTFKAALQAPDGIRFVPDYVDVSIPVEAFTETFLELPVIGVNFPSHLRLVTFPPQVRVTYCVVLSKYALVKESDFSLAIDYHNLVNDRTGNMQKVNILSIPSYLFNVRIYPEEAECLIEEVPTAESEHDNAGESMSVTRKKLTAALATVNK